MTGAALIIWWTWYCKVCEGCFLQFTATILCLSNFPNDFLTPLCWSVVCVAHRRTSERSQSATQPTFLRISFTSFSYKCRWVHFSWTVIRIVAYRVHSSIQASFMYVPVGPLEWGQRLSFLFNLFPDSSVYWTFQMYHFVLHRVLFLNENI